LTVSFKELEGTFGWGQDAETDDSESDSTSGYHARHAVATVRQREASFINDDFDESASEYLPSDKEDQGSSNDSSNSGTRAAGKHVYTCSYTCFHIFHTYICV
jgi:hypothetical protein